MTAAALGTFQVHHDSDIDYDCGLPETGKLWQLEQPELKSAGVRVRLSQARLSPTSGLSISRPGAAGLSQ